jgi:predicted MPP superfamily phosphohydrolase
MNTLRIAQTSDTHLGITDGNKLRKMFRRMASEKPDLVVHCGDYNGGKLGSKAVRSTLGFLREQMPDTPVISVVGNHDYWVPERTLGAFLANLQAVKAAFHEFRVHFLDAQGPYFQGGISFAGHTGWYHHLPPPTNDRNWMPRDIEGVSPDIWLAHRAWRELEAHLQHPGLSPEGPDVLVTHFPVIRPEEPEAQRGFDLYSGNPIIAHLLPGTRYFLNGHAHQLHKGPLQWECGSDYNKPTYQIIEITAKETAGATNPK